MVKSTAGLTDTDDVHYRKKVHINTFVHLYNFMDQNLKVFTAMMQAYMSFTVSLRENTVKLSCYIRTIFFFSRVVYWNR